MITKEQKQNVFKPMLENFETDQMKNYFLDMVSEIPDYIFTMPSSTSGKYHNKTQCETYGQLWHAFMFNSILNHRLRLKGNQEKFQSPIQRDCMRCVPVFHDAIKCGLDGSKHTVHNHPLLAKQWVLETKVEHDIDNKFKKVIADMCAAHSGEWTTSKRSKDVLPEPKNEMEFFIHECDILSSRNDIDMIISKELKELVEENIPIKIEIPDLAEYRISFGRHSGQLLTEIPKSYLKWLLGTDLKEPLKSLVIEVLKMDKANE